MKKSTKMYELFKFRLDNRRIEQAHVMKLVESIKQRNLLDMRPILVNHEMEVIDGQHRLVAAKMLGVDIYYEVQESLKKEDVILMNINKAWKSEDFLNFYCQNGYKDYIKLKDFMLHNNISLKIAIILFMGRLHDATHKFKTGEFVFKDDITSDSIDAVHDTIAFIKRMNGASMYLSSAKFWKAMIRLSSHPDYNHERWLKKLQMLVGRITPKATTNDYMRTIMDIYNYHTTTRIDLFEEVQEECFGT